MLRNTLCSNSCTVREKGEMLQGFFSNELVELRVTFPIFTQWQVKRGLISSEPAVFILMGFFLHSFSKIRGHFSISLAMTVFANLIFTDEKPALSGAAHQGLHRKQYLFYVACLMYRDCQID